ncbi:hypothetical protein J2Z19_003775 [Ensifer adhaerens]|uniref:Uncharacterized protein n=1 Tax=Ensifer adhaerens TaxID=106592 RepID=A0ACC5SYS2_ENSAD|nr:hypothetical protein [Ensifer adhaerens]MBP1874051.1 hypothetical protein [Ensifer adhaerens]
MPRSPLFGRRIHITGSISKELEHASAENVALARQFVAALVKELVKKGANFVVPVDAEPTRDIDGSPKIFDWLIWETIEKNVIHRPSDAPGIMAVAVQHHKSEGQIPPQYREMWDGLRRSDKVKIDNASFWNMASKRMEAQAYWGDILIPIGGEEGALFLTNLYASNGKPVVPVNIAVTPQGTGARRVFEFGLGRANTKRLFQTSGPIDAHGWLNRVNFASQSNVNVMVQDFVDLLEALVPPKAFAVRLLDPMHENFKAVDDFFEGVVKPVIEGQLGFKLIVVDGRQAVDQSRIDADIFAKLHHSQLVIADVTGSRPNCFIELGYALGRGHPTILTAMKGEKFPFDITTYAGFPWVPTKTSVELQKELFEHWTSVQARPPLVDVEPLIS